MKYTSVDVVDSSEFTLAVQPVAVNVTNFPFRTLHHTTWSLGHRQRNLTLGYQLAYFAVTLQILRKIETSSWT